MQLHSPFQIRHDLQNFDAKSNWSIESWSLMIDWMSVALKNRLVAIILVTIANINWLKYVSKLQKNTQK